MAEAAKPGSLIGDRAYDSDELHGELRKEGVEMIALHRRNRRKRGPGRQEAQAVRKTVAWLSGSLGGFSGAVV